MSGAKPTKPRAGPYRLGVNRTIREIKKADPLVLALMGGHVAAAERTADALDGAGELVAAVLREHRLLISEVVSVAEARRREREAADAAQADEWHESFARAVEAERDREG